MRRSAERILTTHVGSLPTLARYVDLLGRERVVARADCGLGGRVWSEAERKLGQAWRNHTVPTFHTYGTPPIDGLA
jgi:hypothetical protein